MNLIKLTTVSLLIFLDMKTSFQVFSIQKTQIMHLC